MGNASAPPVLRAFRCETIKRSYNSCTRPNLVAYRLQSCKVLRFEDSCSSSPMIGEQITMIEFGNFSAQSFERLIQTLSVKILGPGVVVFGSGPDGAREATFEGTVPFPSLEDRWNGYIVVQAKCRETLKADARDGAWLAQQLKRDFEKFVKNKSLRRPDYYIIASNVTLSAEPTNGGRIKVERLVAQYQKKLKFKAVSIWAADELRAHLENARDVRLSYAAWLTPSDVLTELIDHIAKPKLREILPLALARDLRQERDIRLRDAGQETEKPVYLDDLFVDLPFKVGSSSQIGDDTSKEEQEEEEDEEDELSALEASEPEFSFRIVSQILRLAANKLDNESIACRHRPHKDRPGEPQLNRLVILGGPGQGKSTLGQFLAQVSRARLLSQHSSTMLNPQTFDLISPVLERALVEGLPLSGPARFPIRVDLPIFADALQKSGTQGLSLIAFIAARFSRNVDQPISASDLRLWLATCPSLIILDGLDEVPPSGNRAELVKSIDALWDDLTLVKADVLVVVTTRPQGYNDDLSRRYWQHWQLSPLTEQDALKFARRLSEVRLSDPDRREAVLIELNRAAKDRSTMLLLTSPLQVTILFGISLLKGAIPQDRWELFERYYTLLRDREAQKTGPDAKLIRDFKRQIDAIHYQAGFILHVMSETAGGASPHLTLPQFRALIVRLLSDEEHSEGDIASISSELVRIATERLVLLNCRVEERIAFDVRSLQEFMAAAQIAAFSSTIVIERLRTISLSAHWQHVFRIAASKIFSVAELGPLRSEVVGVCHALDNGDLGEDGRLVRAGASLALELLQDGLAHTAPVFRRSLVRRALALLDIGPEMLDLRLEHQMVPDTAKVFQEEIVSRIAQGETPAARAAWSLLSGLLNVDQSFAESLILAHWPDDSAKVLSLIDARRGKWTPVLIKKIKEAQAEAGPVASRRFMETFEWYGPDGDETEAKIQRFSILPRAVVRSPLRSHFFVRDSSNRQICRVSFIPLSQSQSYAVSGSLRSAHGWAPYKALLPFLNDPSSISLGQTLQQLALHGREGLPSHGLPWVCMSMLREEEDGASFGELAEEVCRGEFGDLRDWKDAEQRWRTEGVRPSDFEEWKNGRYFDRKIGIRGIAYPHPTMQVSSTSKASLAEFVPVLQSMNSTVKKLRFVEILIAALRRRPSIPPILEEAAFCAAIKIAKEIQYPKNSRLIGYLASISKAWEMAEFLDFADEVGCKWFATAAPLEMAVHAFNRSPSRRGLLTLMAGRARRLATTELAMLDHAAFETKSGDSPVIRHSVARLRLASGKWDKDDIDGIVADLGGNIEEVILSRADRSILEDHKDYLSLLRASCSGTATSNRITQGRKRPLRELSREISAQPSRLSDESVRATLELPNLISIG